MVPRLQQPMAIFYTVSIMADYYVKTALFFFIYSSDFGCTIGSDVYAQTIFVLSQQFVESLTVGKQCIPLIITGNMVKCSF